MKVTNISEINFAYYGGKELDQFSFFGITKVLYTEDYDIINIEYKKAG